MEEVRKKHMETYDLGWNDCQKANDQKRLEERETHITALREKGVSISIIASTFDLSEEEVLAILTKPSSNA